jgi:hypothetical protein
MRAVTNTAKKLNISPRNTFQIRRSSFCARRPSKNPVDPLAKTNNDSKIPHIEVCESTCQNNPACREKNCQNLCGPLLEERSIAHLSHTPWNDVNKPVAIFLGTPDAKGSSKDQFLITYPKSHLTDPNQKLDPQATAYVKDPIKSKLIKINTE